MPQHYYTIAYGTRVMRVYYTSKHARTSIMHETLFIYLFIYFRGHVECDTKMSTEPPKAMMTPTDGLVIWKPTRCMGGPSNRSAPAHTLGPPRIPTVCSTGMQLRHIRIVATAAPSKTYDVPKWFAAAKKKTRAPTNNPCFYQSRQKKKGTSLFRGTIVNRTKYC